MLEKDTDTVMRWLTTALAAAAKRGIQPIDLARHCGVSPQAVTGWKTTGRIRKSHLAKATEFLGVAPSFGSSAVTAAEPPPNHWPFNKITKNQFNSLPKEQQEMIDCFAAFIYQKFGK